MDSLSRSVRLATKSKHRAGVTTDRNRVAREGLLPRGVSIGPRDQFDFTRAVDASRRR
ncbi:hypothetical protein BN2476_220004 [Paraburkholderia piptadeniae]|uniref:Uncharacterized protein n=1 Tax=Paraburkholderia piptadeniae TaxID=1701573 RepID=A0A1N7RWC7_9BURK|nr:hypothetical protein BN2476_220004 [Paraburkholderia piptadeniae]